MKELIVFILVMFWFAGVVLASSKSLFLAVVCAAFPPLGIYFFVEKIMQLLGLV